MQSRRLPVAVEAISGRRHPAPGTPVPTLRRSVASSLRRFRRYPPPVPRYREILSYPDMLQREGIALQKGMNFRVRAGAAGYSIILMSVRKGAPYQDRWHDDGPHVGMLEYKGHDIPSLPQLPQEPQALRPAHEAAERAVRPERPSPAAPALRATSVPRTTRR